MLGVQGQHAKELSSNPTIIPAWLLFSSTCCHCYIVAHDCEHLSGLDAAMSCLAFASIGELASSPDFMTLPRLATI